MPASTVRSPERRVQSSTAIALDNEHPKDDRGAGIAARVTAGIADALRNGVRPWVQPWSNAAALALPLRSNGAAYRGGNVVVLWMVARDRGYASRYWFSFKQAKAFGGAVRRGERATHVVYYSGATAPTREEEGKDEGKQKGRSVLKTYPVFNAAQVDGLPQFYYAQIDELTEPDDAQLAALFARVPAGVSFGGAQAFYDPVADRVQMPSRTAFKSNALFYATLAHELAHWTGHASRLDREIGKQRTPMAYAREELVAELASAFLGAELGLPVEHIECHASYIDHWIRLLDSDPTTLMKAAARAQAAVDFMRSYMFPNA